MDDLDGLSQLVLDIRLETQYTREIPPNPPQTLHLYPEPDPDAPNETYLRKECWRREGYIGGGSFGRVFLETCVQGRREDELRAVKEIFLTTLSGVISRDGVS
jgi:hypothetical protein